MSVLGQRARELVTSYDVSLERRIARRGSSLVCKDEDLWRQTEAALAAGDARDAHCLGLSPLRVMEESLKASKAAAPTAPPPLAAVGRTRAGAGLQGLEKAFEVLEQAALNLYLGPWREEYKVVKMYSGMFTHYIKPVLPGPYILELFGLLGYKPAPPRLEQLHRQPSSFTSLEDLLCLSCAFFLARCECCLLLSALGKCGGGLDWELSLVQERQRGHSVQEALDNTKKVLELPKEGLLELSGGMDGELDLYTAEEVNCALRDMAVGDDGDESPRSCSLLPAAAAHNGINPPSSSSSNASQRDPVCISTFNCQLPTTSSLGPAGAVRNATAAAVRSGYASNRGESSSVARQRFDGADSQLHSLTTAYGFRDRETALRETQLCDCIRAEGLVLLCTSCNTLHDTGCASLRKCRSLGHRLVDDFGEMEDARETGGAVSPQSLKEGRMTSSTSPVRAKNNPAVSSSSSSLVLHDGPVSISQTPTPIPFHDCCDLSRPDPQFTCDSCWVFHSGTCRGLEYCRNQCHDIRPLQVCPCGKQCSRKPLILCRYCGTEYCNLCWYRNPVECTCGQTFDQSSTSV